VFKPLSGNCCNHDHPGSEQYQRQPQMSAELRYQRVSKIVLYACRKSREVLGVMKLERMEVAKLGDLLQRYEEQWFGNMASSAGGGLPRPNSKLYGRNQLSSADNCKIRPRSNLGGYAVAGGVVSRIHAQEWYDSAHPAPYIFLTSHSPKLISIVQNRPQ
jgi:hypothetical protein